MMNTIGNDEYDFDADTFLSLVRSSKTYEELIVKCDMSLVECIINEDDFKSLKSNFYYC